MIENSRFFVCWKAYQPDTVFPLRQYPTLQHFTFPLQLRISCQLGTCWKSSYLSSINCLVTLDCKRFFSSNIGIDSSGDEQLGKAITPSPFNTLLHQHFSLGKTVSLLTASYYLPNIMFVPRRELNTINFFDSNSVQLLLYCQDGPYDSR